MLQAQASLGFPPPRPLLDALLLQCQQLMPNLSPVSILMLLEALARLQDMPCGMGMASPHSHLLEDVPLASETLLRAVAQQALARAAQV